MILDANIELGKLEKLYELFKVHGLEIEDTRYDSIDKTFEIKLSGDENDIGDIKKLVEEFKKGNITTEEEEYIIDRMAEGLKDEKFSRKELNRKFDEVIDNILILTSFGAGFLGFKATIVFGDQMIPLMLVGLAAFIGLAVKTSRKIDLGWD